MTEEKFLLFIYQYHHRHHHHQRDDWRVQRKEPGFRLEETDLEQVFPGGRRRKTSRKHWNRGYAMCVPFPILPLNEKKPPTLQPFLIGKSLCPLDLVGCPAISIFIPTYEVPLELLGMTIFHTFISKYKAENLFRFQALHWGSAGDGKMWTNQFNVTKMVSLHWVISHKKESIVFQVFLLILNCSAPNYVFYVLIQKSSMPRKLCGSAYKLLFLTAIKEDSQLCGNREMFHQVLGCNLSCTAC